MVLEGLVSFDFIRRENTLLFSLFSGNSFWMRSNP
jgi:hypothetical protein